VDDALHESLLLDTDLTLEFPYPSVFLIFFVLFFDDFFPLHFLTWGILSLLAAT